MKHAFELLAPNDVPTVLIHCIEDEKCAVPYAHGNATSDSKRKYIRTCPSVIKSLKYSCTMETAVKFYQKNPTYLLINAQSLRLTQQQNLT